MNVHPSPPVIRRQRSEWAQRVDLADVTPCERHGWQVIWNHITARVPRRVDHDFGFPAGLPYDEVTASNLVKMTTTGEIVDGSSESLNLAAQVIHGGIYKAPRRCALRHAYHSEGQARCGLKEGCCHYRRKR